MAAILGISLGIAAIAVTSVIGFQAGWFPALEVSTEPQSNTELSSSKTDYIKYVEFNVTYPALEKVSKFRCGSA